MLGRSALSNVDTLVGAQITSYPQIGHADPAVWVVRQALGRVAGDLAHGQSAFAFLRRLPILIGLACSRSCPLRTRYTDPVSKKSPSQAVARPSKSLNDDQGQPPAPKEQPAQRRHQVAELVGDGRVDLYAGFCARRVPRRMCAGGGHPSRPAVAGRLQRPTRRHRAGSPQASAPGRHLAVTALAWPCSGWGLPSHPGHPGCWWALTPPFHPYRPRWGRRSVFCGTVPRVTPGCR